jgi:hypothetical protein
MKTLFVATQARASVLAALAEWLSGSSLSRRFRFRDSRSQLPGVFKFKNTGDSILKVEPPSLRHGAS